MNLGVWLSIITGLICLVLAVFVLCRDRRPLVHRAFIAGMMAFAFEAFLTGLSLRNLAPAEILFWQRLRMIATAFLPGCWFIFALSFGRANAEILVRRYKWVLLADLIIPLVLVTVFHRVLFRGTIEFGGSPEWTAAIGTAGYLLHICLLVGAVLILMALEETLRSSFGRMRWQIKFVVLGIGGAFAFRIYTGSQILLFSSINSNLEMANTLTAMVVCVFGGIAFTRLATLKIDVYLSQSLLYGYLTVFVVGMYFTVVGFFAKIAGYLNLRGFVYVETFWVFLVFLGLAVLLLSNRAQRSLKQFVTLHFKRPHYDYRKEWMDFTQATTSVTEIKLLCSAIARKISRTFDVLSASVWLLDETGEGLELGGSTALTDDQARNLAGSWKGRIFTSSTGPVAYHHERIRSVQKEAPAAG